MENNEMTNDVDAPDEQATTAVTSGDADTVRTPEDGNRVDDRNGSNHGHDDNGSSDGQNDHDSQDTFPRSYVEKLRKSEAKYRERAGKADELAHRLHAALVAADGRLADPEDLPFNEDHLDDPEALAAAVGDLITRKPGLRAQQLGGDVGAGKRGTPVKAPADLISIIRGM